MKAVFLAIIVLAAFIAVWVLFIMPAERRRHQRKLDAIRKKIEQRESAARDGAGNDPGK